MPNPCMRGSAAVRSCALVLTGAAALACTLTPVAPAAPRGPEPGPSSRDAVARPAPSAAERPQPAPSRDTPDGSVRGALTLDEALRLAMARSPELAASTSEIHAREGRALQAGLLPNPALEGEIDEFGGTGELSGFDASEMKLALSQRLETAGKRPKRRRAAEIHADVAASEREVVRLRVRATVRRAFAEVLAAQARVARTERLLELARSSVAEVGRLVSAGATPPVERTRAELEVSTVRIDLEAARRDLKTARSDLAATWGYREGRFRGGDREPRFERAEGDLRALAAPPPLDAVRARLARNPLLARWDREIERREAVVAFEDARRIPDVEVQAGLRHLREVGDTALVAGFSVPLPVFDRNQGDRAAARSALNRARHERHAVEARLAARLERAYQALAARYEEVRELQGSVLPRAREAYRGVRRGYARGLFRNVDVLDAQRRLFELRLREIEALRQYHVAEAELERLTATPSGAQGADREEP